MSGNYPDDVTGADIDRAQAEDDPLDVALSDHAKATLALDKALDALYRWKDESIDAAGSRDAAIRFLGKNESHAAPAYVAVCHDAVVDILEALEAIAHYEADRTEEDEPWGEE